MMRWSTAFLMVCLAVARPLAAQVSELPVPFDSAGKIRSITPQVATRLGLVAPVWPVQGDFVEARLFATNLGGHVISVERRSGAFDRYVLSDTALLSLRSVVNAAQTRTGAVMTEALPQTISQPARGAFVRNQMALAFSVYGGLLASLTDNSQTGTAVYLLAAGTSYFVTTALARTRTITRAQNHLATDGALRGWGMAAGLMYTAAGDADQKAYSAVGLAGALGGAIAGYQYGKRLTDSEAQAVTSVSNFAALTTFGLSGATGLAQRSDDGREIVGPIVAAGAVGYALGPLYPRRARYTVTKGDVQMLTLGAVLGASLGFTPFANADNSDSQAAAGAATAGFLAGIFAADRLVAAPFDYSSADASQVSLGAGAGALMGSAVSVLARPSPEVTLGLVTAGAILGAVAGHKFAQPARAGSGASRVGSASHIRGASVEIDPTAVVLGASRVPGTHGFVTIRF